MSWRETLRPASFRGVTFQVDSTGGSFGRRVALHEYPQRDRPYAEDLGRRTRELSISGFVIGSDYHVERDLLIQAVEAEGSGTLVHPYLGTLQVACTDFSVEESTDEGGVARFSFSFVESGELAFPTRTQKPTAKVASATALAKASALERFADAFDITDWPSWIETDAIAEVTKGITAIRESVISVSGIHSFETVFSDLDDLLTELEALVRTPADLAARFSALFTLLSDWFALLGIDPTPGTHSGSSPAEVQASANATATSTLVRQLALIAACDALTVTAFATSTEAYEALEAISSAMEADAELDDARVATVAYLRGVALGLPALATYSLKEPTPSIVVSFELYGDIGRAGEIESRNDIPHPGFAVGSLNVLAR